MQTFYDMLAQESRERQKASVDKCCNLAKRILDEPAQAQQEVQSLSRGLVPIRLDPEGLMDALRELASRTDQLCGIICAFNCEQPVKVSESSTATHLYRIAQESLTNALKHARPEYAERALQAGAFGYLYKQNAHESLIDAVRTVLAGKTYLSPKRTDRILQSRVGGKIEPGKSPIELLSNRELEVQTLIGQGISTSAIAEQLYLSVRTIDTFREKLKIKLNLASGAELNRYATLWVIENG